MKKKEQDYFVPEKSPSFVSIIYLEICFVIPRDIISGGE